MLAASGINPLRPSIVASPDDAEPVSAVAQAEHTIPSAGAVISVKTPVVPIGGTGKEIVGTQRRVGQLQPGEELTTEEILPHLESTAIQPRSQALANPR